MMPTDRHLCEGSVYSPSGTHGAHGARPVRTVHAGRALRATAGAARGEGVPASVSGRVRGRRPRLKLDAHLEANLPRGRSSSGTAVACKLLLGPAVGVAILFNH